MMKRIKLIDEELPQNKSSIELQDYHSTLRSVAKNRRYQQQFSSLSRHYLKPTTYSAKILLHGTLSEDSLSVLMITKTYCQWINNFTQGLWPLTSYVSIYSLAYFGSICVYNSLVGFNLHLNEKNTYVEHADSLVDFLVMLKEVTKVEEIDPHLFRLSLNSCLMLRNNQFKYISSQEEHISYVDLLHHVIYAINVICFIFYNFQWINSRTLEYHAYSHPYQNLTSIPNYLIRKKMKESLDQIIDLNLCLSNNESKKCPSVELLYVAKTLLSLLMEENNKDTNSTLAIGLEIACLITYQFAVSISNPIQLTKKEMNLELIISNLKLNSTNQLLEQFVIKFEKEHVATIANVNPTRLAGIELSTEDYNTLSELIVKRIANERLIFLKNRSPHLTMKMSCEEKQISIMPLQRS